MGVTYARNVFGSVVGSESLRSTFRDSWAAAVAYGRVGYVLGTLVMHRGDRLYAMGVTYARNVFGSVVGSESLRSTFRDSWAAALAYGRVGYVLGTLVMHRGDRLYAMGVTYARNVFGSVVGSESLRSTFRDSWAAALAYGRVGYVLGTLVMHRGGRL
jgi:hypothetical protein